MTKIIEFNPNYKNSLKSKEIIILLTELTELYNQITNILSKFKRISAEDKLHAVIYFQTVMLKKIDPTLKIDIIEHYALNHLIKETNNVED